MNSDFSCFQSPSYCEFASITCERRTFKFLFMILTVAGHLLGIVLPGSRSPRTPEHGSPVMQDFPNTEAQETTCTGSERTAGIHPHWNSCEIAWASLPTPGSQGCFVISTCLTPFHQRVLSHPRVSVLIKLLFTISGSCLNFSREAADPGEGEESFWLLQGKKGDAGYDDVELSALGTSPVTFSWCCIN